MCLQVLYKFNSQVRAYFDDAPNEVGRHVRQILELIENEQFAAAKIYWWEKVLKQTFLADMKGNELDLGKTPLPWIHFSTFSESFSTVNSMKFSPPCIGIHAIVSLETWITMLLRLRLLRPGCLLA